MPAIRARGPLPGRSSRCVGQETRDARHRFRQGRHRHRRGRGIGRGIALGLAQEGARVVVCDIGASLQGAGTDAGPAQEVVDEIKKAGGEAIASTLSIVEPKNADEIVKAALEAFGRVDILVNNAGILRDVIFHKMSWSDWSDVLDVHLNGSFNMSRACAGAFPRAEFRRLRAHDLDLGRWSAISARPITWRRSSASWGCRARSRSTCSASRCARTASRRSPGPA